MNARDVAIGAAWGVAAATCHAIVPIAVRLLSSNLPAIELVFFRNIMGLVIVLSIMSWGGVGFRRSWSNERDRRYALVRMYEHLLRF